MKENLYRAAGIAAAIMALSLPGPGAMAADDGAVDQLRRLASERFGSPIGQVRPSGFAGLYELETDGQVLYTDPEVRYFFVGHVIDSATRSDLTAARLAELSMVKPADLPRDLAIKSVRGDGARQLYVFEDPYCPYCKKLHQSLRALDNVTIYTFVSARLSPDSQAKADAVWCAADRQQAWDAWMQQAKKPAPAARGCAAPTAQVDALGEKLRVTGTPTLFFADGNRMVGVPDAAELERRLAAAAQTR